MAVFVENQNKRRRNNAEYINRFDENENVIE